MTEMRRVGIMGVILCALAYQVPAYADDGSSPNPPPSAQIPQSEEEFTNFFVASRKEYARSHQQSDERDIRLANQVHVLNMIQKSPDVQDWVGVIALQQLTSNGDASISIEIAENIRVSTSKSPSDMMGATTILRADSNLFNIIKSAKVGGSIMFSGKLIKYKDASDENMILRPEFYMIFTDFKILGQ